MANHIQRLRLLQQIHEVRRGAQEEDVILARIILDRRRRHQPRAQRYWIRPWLARLLDYGHYNRLMTELQNEDVAAFSNFVFMNPAMFQEILTRVAPRLEKFDTWYFKAISPGCRLAITLRILANSERFQSLIMSFVWPTTAFPGCNGLGPVLSRKLWPQNFLQGEISTTPWGQ